MTKPFENFDLWPKLRFPKFRGAGGWEKTPLNVIANPVSERAVQGTENNILSLSGEHGIVLQSDLFGKKVAGENSERYLKIVRNDFVYNDRTTKASIYGTIKRLSKYSDGIVSPIYKCFRFNADENPVFWEWYFESGIHDKQLRSLVNEGARAGRFNISISRFLSTAAWSPNKDEQQKIADCLSSIDELVILETQKLNALKAHKRGLMHLLFPAEGETLPKLRFPEFRNAGEWEKKMLGQLFNRLTTKNTENNQNILTISAQDGLVSQLDYFNKSIASKDVTGYYLLLKGDFAYNKSSSQGYPMGAIKPLKNYEKGVVSTLYICLRVKEGYIESFFEQYFDSGALNNEISGIAQEGARNHGLLNIGVGDFFNVVQVTFPRSEEQQKIADCLASCDELIATHSQKLDMLKAYRKGLMQLLFPVPDEILG